MAIEKIFLIIIIYAHIPYIANSSQDYSENKFKAYEYSELVPTRLLQIMRTYYEEANKRINEMNPMRFMYEESPHYEIGYVLGEIIERYKKIVELIKRSIEYNSDTVFTTLRMTELIQKLYFDIYHLANMLHEIHRKYRSLPEFKIEKDTINLKEVYLHKKWLNDQKREQKRREKQKRKYEKKMNELRMKFGFYNKTTTRVYNKWWPIDYGWEIDYYWK